MAVACGQQTWRKALCVFDEMGSTRRVYGLASWKASICTAHMQVAEAISMGTGCAPSVAGLPYVWP